MGKSNFTKKMQKKMQKNTKKNKKNLGNKKKSIKNYKNARKIRNKLGGHLINNRNLQLTLQKQQNGNSDYLDTEKQLTLQKQEKGNLDYLDGDELYNEGMKLYLNFKEKNPQLFKANAISYYDTIPTKTTSSFNSDETTTKTNFSEKSTNLSGGGTRFNWVYEMTETLVGEYVKINSNPWSPISTMSLSIFNPSITWIQDSSDGTKSYYGVTTRCIIYYDNNTGKPITEDVIDYYYASFVDFAIFPGSIDRSRVIYPGNGFNKWVTCGGFWNGRQKVKGWASPVTCHDDTMFTIFERKEHDIKAVFSQMLSSRGSNCPIDARVFNIFNSLELGSPSEPLKCNTLYVTGSRSGPTDNPPPQSVTEIGKPPNMKNPIDPALNITSPYWGSYNNEMIEKGGWKQSLSRVQVLRNKDGKFKLCFPGNAHNLDVRSLEQCTQESLANCISWYSYTEKNYAMYYYKHENSKRAFCKKKCMLLNFEMASIPSNVRTRGGTTFYYKEFDPMTSSSFDPFDGKQFETSYDASWRTVQPENSDIFYRLQAYYHHISPTASLHVSCTTPFIRYGENSLVAIGHIKVDIFSYLNEKMRVIKEAHPTASYDQIIDYYKGKQHGQKRDHLFCYGISIIKKINKEIVHDPTHGVGADHKYMIEIKNHDRWGPNGFRQYSFTQHSNNHIRQYLRDIEFIPKVINDTGQHIYIPSNLHPCLVYFMFFYSVNKDNLELQTFSHPFMIIHDKDSSYLNFPMGITTHKDDIWFSYGDGDCQCKLASLSRSKLDALMNQNNNNTPVDDIEFWMYSGADL